MCATPSSTFTSLPRRLDLPPQNKSIFFPTSFDRISRIVFYTSQKQVISDKKELLLSLITHLSSLLLRLPLPDLLGRAVVVFHGLLLHFAEGNLDDGHDGFVGLLFALEL